MQICGRFGVQSIGQCFTIANGRSTRIGRFPQEIREVGVQTVHRMSSWSVIAAAFGLSCCFTPAPTATLKRLNETADFLTASGFNFDISPDDKWLVFFKHGDPEAPERPEVHHLYGNLRVMNLHSGQVHAFTIREDRGPRAPMDDVSATWAPDSSMCVLPPPGAVDQRIVIRFDKGETPTVSFVPDPRYSRKPGRSSARRGNQDARTLRLFGLLCPFQRFRVVQEAHTAVADHGNTKGRRR